MGDGGIPLKLHHLLSPGMAFSSVASGHSVKLGREILHYPKAQEPGLDLPPLPSACYIGRTGVFDGCSAPVLSDENMRFGVSAPRSRSRRWASASVGDCLHIFLTFHFTGSRLFSTYIHKKRGQGKTLITGSRLFLTLDLTGSRSQSARPRCPVIFVHCLILPTHSCLFRQFY